MNETVARDRVVAKLRFPIDLGSNGLIQVVKGLQKIYGKGLVIVTDGPAWEDGWMIIATPLTVPDSEVSKPPEGEQP